MFLDKNMPKLGKKSFFWGCFLHMSKNFLTFATAKDVALKN